MSTELYQDGAWSVHQRPRAVRVGDQTFVGSISSDGDVGVTSYDHDSRMVDHTVLAPDFNVDDHDSPAIYVRDDDHIIVFWTQHNAETMYWKISDNPADISSFGAEKSFPNSANYPQPVSWNGDLRIYYRRGGGTASRWRYRDSTDGGESDGSEQNLADFSDSWHYIHPYLDTTGASDRLHFAMGDHRMENTGIYHWHLESGTYYTSGGTSIGPEGTELTTLTDLTQVYDGTASGNNPSKQYDLICDSNGNPHVAFTEHVSTGSGGGDGDYRARWAAWDGSQWTVASEITAMGGAIPENHYYEGGLSLDSQDPTTVYVSVEQSGRNYQIQEWNTDDGGSTWSKTEDLSPADTTITDPTKRGRPISPRNHDGTELTAVWWAGRYDGYTNYDMQVMDSMEVITPGATKYIRQDGSWVEIV